MIQLQLFGGLDVRDSTTGRPITAVVARTKRALLLARLTLAGPAGERRDSLLAHFWPEASAARARHALNQALHVLRRELGTDAFIARGDDVIAINAAHVHSDVADFEAALASGDREGALALYRGDLLAGVFVDDCPELERWVDRERQQLRGRAVRSAWEVSAEHAANGRTSEAVRWAREGVRLAPLDEVGLRRLLALLRECGDAAGAAATYQAFARRLRAELGVEPDASTAALALGSTGRNSPGHRPATNAWPADEPLVSAASPSGAWLSRRTVRRVAGVAVALLLVVLALSNSRREARRGMPAHPVVAILPFDVHGAASHAYLGAGVVDLLTARFDIPGRLTTLDPRATLMAEGQHGAAAPEGATHVVRGAVVAAGDRLELSATLSTAGGTRLATARATAENERDLGAAIDSVTRALFAGYSAQLSDQFAATAAVSTAPWSAVTSYLRGESELRAGRYNAAVDAFQAAVRDDSTFALAHYRLGVAADWAGRSDISSAGLADAWRWRQRLPPRELLLLEGRRARPSAADADRIFRSAVTRYPDAVEAWGELADVWYHAGGWSTPLDDVRAGFARVLAADTAHPAALLHLTRIAALEGRHDALDSLAERVLALGSDGDRAVEVRALRAYTIGGPADRAAARAELQQLDDATVAFVAQRTIQYAMDFAATREVAAVLSTPARGRDLRAAGHVLMAFSEAAAGRMSRAWRHLAAADTLDAAVGASGRALLLASPAVPARPAQMRAARVILERVIPDSGQSRSSAPARSLTTPWHQRLTLGLLSARLRDDSAAETIARALEREPSARARAGAGVIRAMIAWRDGRVSDGLTHIGPGDAPDPVDLARIEQVLRAELLHAAGRDREALRWFGLSAAEMPFGIVHVASALLQAAGIHDRLGEHAQARALYERFVALVRDPDTEHADLVARARRRMVELTGSERD